MITAAQLRAARGLLDWTRNDLAQAANVSPETIKNIEHGTFRPQETTSEAITRAFAVHGVEFIGNEGVRLQKDSVTRLEGLEGFKRFVDSVYQTAMMPFSKDGGDKPLYASNFDSELFAHHLGADYLKLHVDRMNQIPDLTIRILVENSSKDKMALASRENTYRECRQPITQHSGEVPFYVYGDNLAILVLSEQVPQFIVISSAPVAKAYRQHFEVMWATAKPVKEV